MADYIKRMDAVEAVRDVETYDIVKDANVISKAAAIYAINEVPSADVIDRPLKVPTDCISRADAIGVITKHSDLPFPWWQMICRELQSLPSANIIEFDFNKHQPRVRNKVHDALPSADAVHGWRTGKPQKRGEYTVTVKSMRGGMVESLYYGKPMMPNRKVKGVCWYRSDDEWGDVVYDDDDVLAWMPLPKPYKGGDE